MCSDEKYMREIGAVAAAWSALEFQMDFLIWRLIEAQHMLAACVTSQLTTTSARVRSIIALLRLWDAPLDLIQSLNKFEQRTYAIREQRNRIVHDPWAVGESSGTVYQLQASIHQKDLVFGKNKAVLETMRKTYNDIVQLNDDFAKIDDTVTVWIQSSPDKWRSKLRTITKSPRH